MIDVGRTWEDLQIPTEFQIEKLENFDSNDFSDEEIEFLCSLNPSKNEILRKEAEQIKEIVLEELRKKKIAKFRFNSLVKSDLFIRFYTIVHHPKYIPGIWQKYRPNGDSSAPYSLTNLGKIFFENEEKPSLKALSSFMDLIASSRFWEDESDDGDGIPLMPIRGHLFARGLQD